MQRVVHGDSNVITLGVLRTQECHSRGFQHCQIFSVRSCACTPEGVRIFAVVQVQPSSGRRRARRTSASAKRRPHVPANPSLMAGSDTALDETSTLRPRELSSWTPRSACPTREHLPPCGQSRPPMQYAAFTLITGPTSDAAQQEPSRFLTCSFAGDIADLHRRVTSKRTTTAGSHSWCATLPRRH